MTGKDYANEFCVTEGSCTNFTYFYKEAGSVVPGYSYLGLAPPTTGDDGTKSFLKNFGATQTNLGVTFTLGKKESLTAGADPDFFAFIGASPVPDNTELKTYDSDEKAVDWNAIVTSVSYKKEELLPEETTLTTQFDPSVSSVKTTSDNGFGIGLPKTVYDSLYSQFDVSKWSQPCDPEDKDWGNFLFKFKDSEFSFVIPPQAYLVSTETNCDIMFTKNEGVADQGTLFIGDFFYGLFDTTFTINDDGSTFLSFSVSALAPEGTKLGGVFGLSFSAIAAVAAAALAF